MTEPLEPSFRIDIQADGPARVVRPLGELDIATAPELERTMTQVWAAHSGPIVLDLSGLTFLDSTGIRALLEVVARSRADGGRLRVRASTSSQVLRVLQAAQVAEHLPYE